VSVSHELKIVTESPTVCPSLDRQHSLWILESQTACLPTEAQFLLATPFDGFYSPGDSGTA